MLNQTRRSIRRAIKPLNDFFKPLDNALDNGMKAIVEAYYGKNEGEKIDDEEIEKAYTGSEISEDSEDENDDVSSCYMIISDMSKEIISIRDREKNYELASFHTPDEENERISGLKDSLKLLFELLDRIDELMGDADCRQQMHRDQKFLVRLSKCKKEMSTINSLLLRLCRVRIIDYDAELEKSQRYEQFIIECRSKIFGLRDENGKLETEILKLREENARLKEVEQKIEAQEEQQIEEVVALNTIRRQMVSSVTIAPRICFKYSHEEISASSSSAMGMKAE